MPEKPPPLYGPDGKLIEADSMEESGLDFLAKQGVTRNDRGDLVIPTDVIKRMRSDRLRDLTVSTVPSVPRHMQRDAGGVGVRKGFNKFETFSLELLRKLRERSPMLQAIHSARHYQVRRMSRRWGGRKIDVGWHPVHKDHQDQGAKIPEGFEKYIAKAETMLERPSHRYCPTMGQMITQLEEDLLTINRPIVEKLYSMYDKSRVVGFRPVDGAIVWPTMLWIEKWIADTPQWHGGFNPDGLSNEEVIELASEAAGWDLYGVPYCLVREGVLEGVYRAGKLVVAPIVNRTDINVAGYPPSHVEQAIEIVLSYINAWDYNATFFTRGLMAEFILGVSGDVHDEDIHAFVDMLRESAQGVRRAHQPPVMPLPVDGTLQKIDLKPNNRDMMFELWMSVLSSLCAAIYRMDMSVVNMKPWDGGSGSSLSEPSREMEIALAKEEGLQGDLQHLADTVFDPLLRTIHPDLRLKWEFGDYDPKKEAELYEVRARTSITRNEVRVAEGQMPMGFYLSDDEYQEASEEDKQKFHDNLWNMPTDPSFASSYMQAKMQEQMADQEQQPQDDGFGAAPDEDVDGFGAPQGGEDDGFGGGPGQGASPFGQPPGQEGGGPAGQPPGPGGPMQKGTRDRITVYVEES